MYSTTILFYCWDGGSSDLRRARKLVHSDTKPYYVYSRITWMLDYGLRTNILYCVQFSHLYVMAVMSSKCNVVVLFVNKVFDNIYLLTFSK